MMAYETNIDEIKSKVEKIRSQLVAAKINERRLHLNLFRAVKKNADIIKPHINNFNELVLIAHQLLGLESTEDYILYSDIIMKRFMRRAFSIEMDKVINEHKGAMERFLINDHYILDGLDSGTKTWF